MERQKLKEILEKKGYTVQIFQTAAEACDYLDRSIDGSSVSFGGSVTVQQLGLKERLATHNEIVDHWNPAPGVSREETMEKAMHTKVYLSSVNGLAESGELVNIDGTGNRVAGTLFGHEKVYFVLGKNKLAPTLEQAIWRARNIAGPKNAQRLGRKTPCALKADRCYDCDSPERICKGLVVMYEKIRSCQAEIIFIEEDLGY